MGEANRRKRSGLIQDDDGSYWLNLRQVIFLTLNTTDSKPATAVQRFVDALANAQFGPRPTDMQKVDIFEAWLKGKVKGTDASVTIGMQILSEALHEEAPGLMTMLHKLARADDSAGRMAHV